MGRDREGEQFSQGCTANEEWKLKTRSHSRHCRSWSKTVHFSLLVWSVNSFSIPSWSTVWLFKTGSISPHPHEANTGAKKVSSIQRSLGEVSWTFNCRESWHVLAKHWVLRILIRIVFGHACKVWETSTYKLLGWVERSIVPMGNWLRQTHIFFQSYWQPTYAPQPSRAEAGGLSAITLCGSGLQSKACQGKPSIC